MPAETASLGTWVFVALGVCAGVVSGMPGVGSGTVIIPALVLVLSIPQKSAQGMCLAAMIPMVAVGALRYRLNPDIHVSMSHAALIAIGGVAGAFVGVEIATRLSGGILRRVFACFIIAVGLRMLLASGGQRSASATDSSTRGSLRTDEAASFRSEFPGSGCAAKMPNRVSREG